ncbi:F0F1 ATP synthase subunit B family protein [Wolbachia endosymbiont of Ctenocephalides felis wCfeT]|uniref:F0F1 ATP synthase subunit B family protein n=1 Tax=Wolbachia endosymbiont of Ctenocephalides felis wCfeT TaxID=2732593 RepID=UPI001447E6AC|nr:hypothetical protein [Wolbachia endosymbiont of Ctenocephalides felis wCfeT]
MPQLDVSTFFSQVFWFLIFFSALFFAVRCLFLPKLERIINYRNKEVLDSFNISYRILKVAERQIAEYNAALSSIKMKAKKVIDNALIEVEEMEASVKKVLEEEDKKMVKLIEERVEQFKSEYNDELKQAAISIALIYYTKLTNSEIDKELVANLVSEKF